MYILAGHQKLSSKGERRISSLDYSDNTKYTSNFLDPSLVNLDIRIDLGQRVKALPIGHLWSDLQILPCKVSFHCFMTLQEWFLYLDYF